LQQQSIVLNQLEVCPDIDHHAVLEFLSVLATSQPDKAAHLLMSRVERAEGMSSGSREYNPIPYNWNGFSNIEDHPQYSAVLLGVLDWMAEDPNPSWQRMTMGSRIFRFFVGDCYDERVMVVLDGVIKSGCPRQFSALIGILNDAPKQVIWEDVPFVTRVLRTGRQMGEECLSEAISALYSATIAGVKSGVAGEPFPEDIEQRNLAADIICGLSAGSPERQFYELLMRSAKDSVRGCIERAEVLADGRSW
jgi:hypothetical protein